MNVIGYVRVSTEEQSREGVSVDTQIAKIKAYCLLYDLTLIDVIVDAGISAKTLKRRTERCVGSPEEQEGRRNGHHET